MPNSHKPKTPTPRKAPMPDPVPTQKTLKEQKIDFTAEGAPVLVPATPGPGSKTTATRDSLAGFASLVTDSIHLLLRIIADHTVPRSVRDPAAHAGGWRPAHLSVRRGIDPLPARSRGPGIGARWSRSGPLMH